MAHARRAPRSTDIETAAQKVDEIHSDMERADRHYRALSRTWGALLLLGIALTFTAFLVDRGLGSEASAWVDALTIALGGAFALSGVALALLSRYSPSDPDRALVIGCAVLSVLAGALPIALVIT